MIVNSITQKNQNVIDESMKLKFIKFKTNCAPYSLPSSIKYYQTN